jgi:hypothetical protein
MNPDPWSRGADPAYAYPVLPPVHPAASQPAAPPPAPRTRAVWVWPAVAAGALTLAAVVLSWLAFRQSCQGPPIAWGNHAWCWDRRRDSQIQAAAAAARWLALAAWAVTAVAAAPTLLPRFRQPRFRGTVAVVTAAVLTVGYGITDALTPYRCWAAAAGYDPIVCRPSTVAWRATAFGWAAVAAWLVVAAVVVVPWLLPRAAAWRREMRAAVAATPPPAPVVDYPDEVTPPPLPPTPEPAPPEPAPPGTGWEGVDALNLNYRSDRR